MKSRTLTGTAGFGVTILVDVEGCQQLQESWESGSRASSLVIVLLWDLRILLKFEKVSTFSGMVGVEVANVAILVLYTSVHYSIWLSLELADTVYHGTLAPLADVCCKCRVAFAKCPEFGTWDGFMTKTEAEFTGRRSISGSSRLFPHSCHEKSSRAEVWIFSRPF